MNTRVSFKPPRHMKAREKWANYQIVSENRLNFGKYLSASLIAKLEELSKCLNSMKDLNLTSLCGNCKNWWGLAGMSYYSRHSQLIMHIQITKFRSLKKKKEILNYNNVTSLEGSFISINFFPGAPIRHHAFPSILICNILYQSLSTVLLITLLLFSLLRNVPFSKSSTYSTHPCAAVDLLPYLERNPLKKADASVVALPFVAILTSLYQPLSFRQFIITRT